MKALAPAADPLGSAAALIRCLKTPALSPAAKIDVALAAWAKEDLYIPAKRGLFMDWAVQTMSGAGAQAAKGKGKEKESTAREGLDALPLTSRKYWQLLDLLLAPSSADSSAAAAVLPSALSSLLTQLFRQLCSHSSPTGSVASPVAEPYVELLAVLASPARKLLSLTPNVAEALLDLLGEALACWITLALPAPAADGVWAEVLGVLVEELDEVLPNNLTRRKIAQALVKSPSLPLIINLLGTLSSTSPLKGPLLHLLSSLLFPVDVLKAYVAPVQPSPAPPRVIGKQKALPTAAAPKAVPETAPEEKALFKLLATLLSSAASPTLSFLPELLDFYTQLLATHRHTLFPLPPHLRMPVEVHASDLISKATLRFVTALSTLINEAPRAGSGAERWACRKGIWSVVEDRGKVGRGYEEASSGFGDIGSGGWRTEAKGVLEGGVKRLEGLQSQAGGDTERDELIGTLATLGRMDRELMDPFLKRFLVAVAAIPTPHAPTASFLNSLQDYHRQTRTLPAFVALLYSTIPAAAAGANQAVYRQLSLGPLFDKDFVVRLSKGLSGFLGVQGQIAEGLEELKEVFATAIAEATAAMTADTADATADADGERKKKRRKTKKASSAGATAAAATLSLLSRLARTCLSSAANLLTNNLPSALLAGLTNLYQQLLDEIARPLISLGLVSSTTWAGEMILVSGIRLWSALKPVIAERENEIPADVVGRLGLLAADKATGGEAVYEIIRILLRNLLLPSLDVYGHDQIIDSTLHLLSKSYSDSDEWTGWASDLDDDSGRRKGPLSIAVWSVLVERGGEMLGVIDYRASPEQLKLLANLIISSYHSVSQSSAQAHTLHSLTNLLLQQAPFAELTELRQHILGALQTYTDMSTGNPSVAQSSAYHFLLSMPIEYLPKQQRVELAHRALRLERAIKLMSAKAFSAEEIAERLRAREVLRRFSATVFREINVVSSVAVDQATLDYIMVQSPADYLDEGSAVGQLLEQSTRSVLESLYRSILRRASNEELARLVGRAFHEDIFGPFHDSMTSLNPEDLAEEDESTSVIDFPVRSALLLLSTMKDEIREPSQLSPELGLEAKVTEVCSTIEEGLGHLISHVEADPRVGSDSCRALVDLTAALTTVKTFLRWLGVKSPASTLTANLTNLGVTVRDPSTALASAVIELRVAQLRALDESDRVAAIENLAASWLVFYGGCLSQANDVTRLTAALQAFSKGLSSAERTMVVQSFIETAVSSSAPVKLVEAALAGANHIFSEGAELSNRPIVTDLLDAGRLLINCPASWEVVSQVVQSMGTICSDKASHLQSQDVGIILAILCLALAPRTSVTIAPASSTVKSIFHQITTAATFLVRHRRDLVLHSAPHLAALLSHLIGSLRTVRPNLGGRQHRLLANSLPGWLNVALEPLGAHEAKALARLLTSLTAKTIPRVPAHLQAVAANQKADSLAGPLAKHAPFVLLAYIHLLTDLSSVVRPIVRRELEPGVGAICEMVGERDRDAIMVGGGLDAGGKGVLKMVWNEWEAKRYAGRG